MTADGEHRFHEPRLLRRLAGLYGVQTGYHGMTGRYEAAGPEALLAVLAALGAPVTGFADLHDAVRGRRQAVWRRLCEPVVAGWAGEQISMHLRLPTRGAEGPFHCRLELEGGETRHWSGDLGRLRVLRSVTVEGMSYVIRKLILPAGLPWGYHRLTLVLPAGVWEALVIVAPREAYLPPDEEAGRAWGVFLPLYALHSARTWGAGDLGVLEALLSWVRAAGGGLVGTLPLLPAFLDEPFDPSPYAPVSRLFWNEFYLDIGRVPELERCPEAQELAASPVFREEIEDLRAAPLVDYRRGMAVRRRVLALLARSCFDGESGRHEALWRWARARPAARDYARFRAVAERRRAGWPAWPERMRGGALQEGDCDPEAERYHLYVQWLVHEQVESLAARTGKAGSGLYLDLPLGVHGGGYDTWREREAFALDASGGAPPDAFFTAGQDWGFPPLHPERIREQGYRYYIASLRHHLRPAGVLRIDHVMGMHRLFWVPRGMGAENGVYVRYRAREFYAVLSLESHRHRALIVGEDLGVVPGYVRQAMARHRVQRMYVLPFEHTPESRRRFNPVPADSLAVLNTHDMPPFAGDWCRKESAEQVAFSLSLHHQGCPMVAPEEPGAVVRACLATLAASRARILLVNLEDLWLEPECQNVPGTGAERGNWRRKARYSFEEFSRDPGVLELLKEINALRNRGWPR
ncbi:MAG: 4-alpha-glucanotransferase [Bacillota bacterium]